MKIVSFFVILTTSVLLLGNVPTTTRQFSRTFAKVIGGERIAPIAPEAMQQLSDKYEILHNSLLSGGFNPQVEQQFDAFRQELDEAGVSYEDETMLYVAALAGNHDAAAAALEFKRQRDNYPLQP